MLHTELPGIIDNLLKLQQDANVPKRKFGAVETQTPKRKIASATTSQQTPSPKSDPLASDHAVSKMFT